MQIQKDILTEYYSHADRLLLFKIDFYYSRFYRQINLSSLYLTQVTFEAFYCSRFYRQINLSSLYLTQVTFEDLPWFTLSMKGQTRKIEDRSKK